MKHASCMLSRSLLLAVIAILAVHPAANASHGVRSSPECAPSIGASTVPTQIERPIRLHVGLALGSGSMHGLAHVGVLEAIEEAGLDVQVVTGTSVGALVGALWSSGLGAREIHALASGGDWDSSRAISSGQLERLFGARSIESFPRRFAAVATNLENGHRRLLTAGDPVAALQASSAAPLFRKPVWIAGERLADGALVEPVPVVAARDLGADFVIAVDVAYRPYEESADGLVAAAFQPMHILVNALADAQVRDADFALRLDVHRRFVDCGPEAVISAGRDAMRRVLPELARAIARKQRAR